MLNKEGIAMNAPILVTYATRHGSTVDIAEMIAQTLLARGNHVDVYPISQIATLSRYRTVVVGSATRA